MDGDDVDGLVYGDCEDSLVCGDHIYIHMYDDDNSIVHAHAVLDSPTGSKSIGSGLSTIHHISDPNPSPTSTGQDRAYQLSHA